MQSPHEPRAPADFPDWRFETLDFAYDAETRSVWMSFKADGPHCFTVQTLTDLANVRASLRALFASNVIGEMPVHYAALASNKPGVFNLGGDLALFADAIRRGERELLRAYAHACVDVVYGGVTAYGLPIVTVAVISGQALGGGLEAALANDVLFAEEGASIGVPEIAFNTFPGMGAVTLLTRRIGAPRAEKMIAGGKTYSAGEMQELGVIDHVLPQGEGVAGARAWMIEGGEARRLRRLAVMKARRTCFPVSLDELIRIVDVWTNCSFDVTARDLRHMDRLAAAQKRIVTTVRP
jgi:DSF synthase